MRVAATLLILTLVACGGREQTSSTNAAQQPAAQSAAANITPEELGELGAKIQKDPARADQLLAEKGLTQESFEKAIRDVTESTDASKRYAQSYKRVSG